MKLFCTSFLCSITLPHTQPDLHDFTLLWFHFQKQLNLKLCLHCGVAQNDTPSYKFYLTNLANFMRHLRPKEPKAAHAKF